MGASRIGGEGGQVWLRGGGEKDGEVGMGGSVE